MYPKKCSGPLTVHLRAWIKRTLSRVDDLKEQYLLYRGETWCLTPEALGAIHHHGALGRQWDQGALRRCKARGVEQALADIFPLVVPPIVVAAILGSHHVLEDRP